MEILILFFIAIAAIRNVSGAIPCVTEDKVSCVQNRTDVKYILIDKHYPKEKCSSVKIENTTYIYDTVNITKVLVTVTNKNKSCDLNSLANMKTELNLNRELIPDTEQIIFINIDDKYIQMIYAKLNENGTYSALTFSSKFEQNLKKANYSLYPFLKDPEEFGRVCLNGGTLNVNYTGAGYMCKCHKRSISFGPRCEYMDRDLNSAIYFFNKFRSNSYIHVTFSLFSNGMKKNQSLVTIKDSNFQRVVEISFNESKVILKTNENENFTEFTPIDNQIWNDFSIELTTKRVSLMFSSRVMSIVFPTELKETFMSNYLVLKEDNLSEFSICIRNLKANRQIIDLNNADGYESCCLDRCNCAENQDCVCKPFMTNGNSQCYCKNGFDKKDNICIPSSLKYSEIGASKNIIYPNNNNYIKTLDRVDFKFRTLSTDGTLVTVSLVEPTTNISSKILNNNLVLSVNNENQTITYNVSDGEFHSVTLLLKIAFLEMILDDNANYSCTVLSWSNITTFTPNSVMLGPLLSPFNSTINNFTTCFSAIRLNGAIDKPYDINLTTSSEMLPQCSDGPRCNSGFIKCLDNQRCIDNEWQNTKCICNENFTSIYSKCIFNKCIVNPCQFEGVCFYNSTIRDYQCQCKSGRFGNNCESSVSTAELWWIAILVVLLLLLIILILLLVYCCCYRNRRIPESPYIKEIHENTVIYNEQAGECDYNGPPINYDLMMKALDSKGYNNAAPINPAPELMNKKLEIDKNNNDLILDHPLEYGYEGYNSDSESVSTLGSNSTNSQLNTLPLDNTNNRFNYLSDLYK